ncbi:MULTISPECIES: aminotransferase class IV [Bacillaceae]|uniref:Aminotransferase class IV n=1 Tax=Evansella alkalicola TaxID=745819 RepID=A0ABS6JW76_9BACI|nr:MULTISPECIES: aminotransferase class IV [Bacillaceae]MBU9721934.1 aminotransferase class IV [Bacillus alkalicola]
MGEIAFYMDQFVGINDKVVPIQERGHQFGDGIYEVIRVYGGQPFLLEEHLDRLEKSAEALSLVMPYSREKLRDIILEGLKRSEIKDAEIYLQITRGIGARQHHYPEVSAVFSLTVRQAKNIDETKRMEGIKVMLTEDIRWSLCYIKSLNLLPNVMAKQEAISSGNDEAVFIKNGIVTEGSSSNLFVVKDGELYTHPATNGILHGITRAKVMELAKKVGFNVREEQFDEEFLLNGDEAFITGTSTEVLPIRFIGDKELSKERPIVDRLVGEYQRLYKN